METAVTYTKGDRVKVPGGIYGTVDLISMRLKRHPIWVLLDTGQMVSFAPEELVKVEPPPSIMGMPLPQPGGTP